MAAHVSPPNGISVGISTQRRDPQPTSDRDLFLHVRMRGNDPENHVLVGPFADHDVARMFLQDAFAATFRPKGPAFTLGSTDEWEIVEVELR